MTTTKLDKQLDQIVKAFETMQKIQTTQALQLNTTTVNIGYIQKDIQDIKNSLKDSAGIFATKIELIDLEREINASITNTAQSVRAEKEFEISKLREEIKLPIKMIYTTATLVLTAVIASVLRLVIR